MSSFKLIVTRAIVRWTRKLERAVRVKLDPSSLMACATIIVMAVQTILILALSLQDIHCQPHAMRLFQSNQSGQSLERLPNIFVITPTYSRHVQKAELTRLSQTLLLVPNVHWILVEDSTGPTTLVSDLVKRLSKQFSFNSITQLYEPTPAEYKLKLGEPSWRYPKGVWQRNKALSWLREHKSELRENGVVYFADDDNTYDIELFNEMRYTNKVSVWPVAFVGGLLVERPVVEEDYIDIGRVRGFNSLWEPKRAFPLDMAGFAINIQLVLKQPNASFSPTQRIGYMESHFLGQFIESWKELEPKASRCKRILVWHTKTKNPVLHEEKKLKIPSHSGMDW